LPSVFSAAYIIMNERLNLRITILNINALLPHEETIPELLERLTTSIKNDRCLNHPIIVDAESLVVLDGVHRVAALKKLGCKRVPTCLVDYKSPAIDIFSWHRTIEGTDVINQLLAQVKYIGSSVENVNQIDWNVVGISPIVAAVKTLNEGFLVISNFGSLKEAYDVIERIEKRLRTVKLEVRYETESDALLRLNQRKVDAVLLTPRLTKDDIIETARSGKIFAYKATRHIIPARPMNLCVPLCLLKNNKSLRETNEKLKIMLQKKRLKHIPPGSVFEGRRYEEDLYMFEENNR